MGLSKALTGKTPAEIRHELQSSDDGDMRRRRWIVGLSFVGIAAMGAVSLRQFGMVRRLPDVPGSAFDSNRVNLSETSFESGIPDASVSIAALALNAPLAQFGGADRARRTPWVPLLAAAKAGLEAAAAARFFYLMPAKEKAWCIYCIVGAAMNVSIAALSMPEARRAWKRLAHEHPLGEREP